MTDLRQLLGIDDVLGRPGSTSGDCALISHWEGKEGRFAFIVAHEIAHWQLHRPLYEMEKVTFAVECEVSGWDVVVFAAAGAKPDAIVCRAKDRKSPAEWQAEQFAVRLLMPACHARRYSEGIRQHPASVAWTGRKPEDWNS